MNNETAVMGVHYTIESITDTLKGIEELSYNDPMVHGVLKALNKIDTQLLDMQERMEKRLAEKELKMCYDI